MKPAAPLACSFCGKNEERVQKLISGPGVYICDECVDLCEEIINEEDLHRARTGVRGVVEAALRAYDARDADGYRACWARDAVAHLPDRSEAVEGRDAVAALDLAAYTGFPDFHVTRSPLVVQPPLVAFRWRFRGTHAGEYLGVAATGREVNVVGATFLEVEEGKLQAMWLHGDTLSLARQLGQVVS